MRNGEDAAPAHDDSRRNRGRKVALLVAVALLLVVVAFGVSVVRRGILPTDRAADQHATNAAIVMLRGNAPLPARWAAYRVVGGSHGDGIEALEARGTTYHGRIVLRIAVTMDEGFVPLHAVRCYLYDLRHTMQDYQPRLVPCPRRISLILASPPPSIDLTQKDVDALDRVLDGLSPSERRNYDALRAMLMAKYGPPATVTVGGGSPNTTFIEVANGGDPEQCLLASVRPTGPVDVWLRLRTDCTGG